MAVWGETSNATTLKAAIQAYAENDDTDFTDHLDTIIALAELRCVKEADLSESRQINNTVAIAANVDFTTSGALPTNIVFIRWVKVASDGAFLLPKDESFVYELNSNSDSESTPKFYSWKQDEDTLQVAPTPNTAITLEIAYNYRMAGIVSGTTSWLGDNAPDFLLYACLVESMSFMKVTGEQRQMWLEMYKRALDTLKVEEEGRRRTDEFRRPEKR